MAAEEEKMPQLTTQPSDVSVQESVDSRPAGSRKSMWGGFSRGGEKVRSPSAYSSAAFAKGGDHGDVDHDKMRKHSVALAHRISVHTSRLATERELAKAGVRPVFTTNDPLWNRRWAVFNPRHRYVQYWDLNTLVLLVITCLVTPYEIAFMDGQRGTNVEILFWVNQYINLSFVFDMLIICLLPFEGEDGQWVVDKKEIFWRYLRSMFFIDLMSIAPFDIIERVHTANTGPEDGDIANLKAFRILKLLGCSRCSGYSAACA